MTHERLDFCIEEAGCLLWLAPSSLGGLSPEELAQVWMGEREIGTRDLVQRGVMMPMALYQDDGYLVRFVTGELSEREAAEWTARVSWKLDIPCGKVLISGVLTPDFDKEFAAMEVAEPGGSHWIGAQLEVPPGKYRVDVHGYPPGDLSGGWGRITVPRMFGSLAGLRAEKPLDYWQRTRPGATPPAWMADTAEEEGCYVDFLVRLSPLGDEPLEAAFEEDGCLQWEFRKPEICPAGIRANL